MANAVSKVRKAFEDNTSLLTIQQIRDITGLKSSEISMALCYLKRQRYATVEQIDNPSEKGRGKINQWQYYPDKVRGVY